MLLLCFITDKLKKDLQEKGIDKEITSLTNHTEEIVKVRLSSIAFMIIHLIRIFSHNITIIYVY